MQSSISLAQPTYPSLDIFLPAMIADYSALREAGRPVRLVIGPDAHGAGQTSQTLNDQFRWFLLDSRTLTGVTNDEQGEVSGDTRFHFEQSDNRIRVHYLGGEIVDRYLVGVLDGNRWDIRYIQINEEDETATGHSVGEIKELEDGRVRVEGEWEWESKDGAGESVLEETKE